MKCKTCKRPTEVKKNGKHNLHCRKCIDAQLRSSGTPRLDDRDPDRKCKCCGKPLKGTSRPDYCSFTCNKKHRDQERRRAWIQKLGGKCSCCGRKVEETGMAFVYDKTPAQGSPVVLERTFRSANEKLLVRVMRGTHLECLNCVGKHFCVVIRRIKGA